MITLKTFSKRFIAIFVCIAFLFIVFKDRFFITPTDDIESKLYFIQQQKDIPHKDFSFIIDFLRPKEDKALPIEPLSQEYKEPQAPLKLHAILNNKALINEEWISLYSTINYNDKIYILEKITKHGIFLYNKDDSNDRFYLEIFTTPKELFLDIR